ncbi:MAG: BON domain-containing protein [Betaproteobacteria bacterium]
MGRLPRLIPALWLATLPVAAASGDLELRNWFDDPFFQVRTAVLACPTPLGPLTDEAEMRKQTHSRSERGTRCWLAGQCRLPSSYLYDAGIAAAVRARFEATRTLRDASLWVTVQRRIVWVEGCVARAPGSTAIDKLLRGIPDIELVVVNVLRAAGAAPPYRTLDSAQAAPPRRP